MVARPVCSSQFCSAVARPSYQASGAGPSSRTAETRTPRASQRPSRPASAVPCHVQSTPSALVAYSVVIRSVASGSSSGWQEAQACHWPSYRTITGSLTASRSLPGITVRGVAVARPSGVLDSSRTTRQCLVPGVATLT